MDTPLSVPGGFTAAGLHRAAKTCWKAVDGADGYILRYYRAEAPQLCIKTRYAIGTSKVIMGFENGREYLAEVCAFIRKNGREIMGPFSEKVPFTPISHKLTAQKVICMQPGETAQIRWEYKNTVPPAAFVSSDSLVASVDEAGTVTALSSGEADILLSSAGETVSVKISVGRKLSRKRNRQAEIIIAGDLMCSAPLQRKAEAVMFDFSEAFAPVREIISRADFSAAVLETVCCDNAPFEHEQLRTDCGSPNCNSPSTFAAAAAYAGFDALITANNHNCDHGIWGAEETIRIIKENGMINIGAMGDDPVVRDICGIKTAFIAQSMISNGTETNIDDKTGLLARYSPESFAEHCKAARSSGAEIIIAVIHWGRMNSAAVRKYQREAARLMADCGADVIIGSHPHVMQEYSEIISSDGRTVPCIYSLGNFLTAMSELPENRYGGAARISVREKNGRLSCTLSLIPVISTDTQKGVKVYPVFPIGDELREKAAISIKELCGRKMPSGRHKILLQGSAVLKRIFESSCEDIDGTGLIISPLTVFSGKGCECGEGGTNLKTDIEKSFEGYMSSCGADFIAVDFYAAAAISCIKISDSLYTASNAFLRSGHFSAHKDISQRIAPPFKEDFWKPLIKSYAEKLLSVFPKERIILIRLEFPSMGVVGSELRNCSPKASVNRLIKQMEEYFIELAAPCVIDVSRHYFRDCNDSSPSAFEPAFYEHCARAASEITEGKSGRFYISERDTEIWFDRVMKYYHSMTARAYQSRLLDMDNAADEIIAETSREFATLNRPGLIRLKNAGVSLCYVEKFLGNNSSSELISAARAINAIKSGDISRPFDEYSVIFKYNFRIIKKLVQLLREKTGADVTEKNAQVYLLLANDPQRLREYSHAHDRIKADIWGSCISREALNRAADKIEVSRYIFKQPCIIADEPPIDHAVPEDSAAFCSSSWRRRTVAEAFSHAGKGLLRESGGKWLIADMYDLVCSMMEFKGGLFETDDFILRTDFYASIAKDCTPAYLFHKRTAEECRRGMESFAEFARSRYGSNIILIRADLKSSYIDLDFRLKPLETDRIEEKRAFIRTFEDMFAELTGCCVIDISKHFYGSDSFPLGGAHMVHYEDEFYALAGRYVSEIISGSGKRYYDKADDDYIFLRDLKLGRK